MRPNILEIDLASEKLSVYLNEAKHKSIVVPNSDSVMEPQIFEAYMKPSAVATFWDEINEPRLSRNLQYPLDNFMTIHVYKDIHSKIAQIATTIVVGPFTTIIKYSNLRTNPGDCDHLETKTI